MLFWFAVLLLEPFLLSEVVKSVCIVFKSVCLLRTHEDRHVNTLKVILGVGMLVMSQETV